MAIDRSGRGTDPFRAYNALAKYFGLRARDAFLDPLKPQSEPKQNTGNDSSKCNPTQTDPFGTFKSRLFSQGHTFDIIEDLDKVVSDTGDQKKNIAENISITTHTGKKFADFYNKSQ